MKVVVVVKPGKGGRGVSQAARYISGRDRDEAREGPEARKLFSDAEDQLGFHRANRLLGGGREPVTNDVLHLVISFHCEEDFIRLGMNEVARQQAVRRITRQTVRGMATSLSAEGLRWVAGIHRNTDNPHVHLLIHRDFFDRETGRKKRLENLPKEMRVSWTRATDGSRIVNPGALSRAFESLLEHDLKRADVSQERDVLERDKERLSTGREEVAHNRSGRRPAGGTGPTGEKVSSDMRLMDLVALNPSLGGRELMKEVIERGPAPEETERPRARGVHAALRVPGLDDPEYRTPAEHADWLGGESQELRDLYERGAEIKGDTLVIPAEEHELPEDREPPFITTLAYAQERFNNVELAGEFHRLALAIGGETADERTRIEVFKTYYERITRGGRGNQFVGGREAGSDDVLARTLGEMRTIASEMAGLETLESVEAKVTVLASDMRDESAPPAFPSEELSELEDREDEPVMGKANIAARRVRLSDESLRLPAGLDYETKEGLVSRTIPEIDRRLESGVSREALFRVIDRKMYRPDPAAYLSRLAELAGTPKDDDPQRPLSREEHVESRLSLLRLCEEDLRRVLGSKAARGDNGRDLHEVTRLARVESLIARLKRELSGGGPAPLKGQAVASRLYVSLPGGGAAEDTFRLPVSSVRVFEAMTKIAASANLSLRTWRGRAGREVRPGLTEQEKEMRSRVANFLKDYINERLRDPETRALNYSPVFREARASIINTSTPEDLGRAAAAFLRVNERRSEECRRYLADPVSHQPPSVTPLRTRERNLLFFGRAPDHHTREMRELRINYGLSRVERAARITKLREGGIDPSDALRAMLRELDERRTAKAVAHFQACVINDKAGSASRINLYRLNQKLPPHERTYLYELAEEKKRELLKSSQAGRAEDDRDLARTVDPLAGRAVGIAPRESRSFREYTMSMGRIERQLLSKAVKARTPGDDSSPRSRGLDNLTISEARSLLHEETITVIRLRDQAVETRDVRRHEFEGVRSQAESNHTERQNSSSGIEFSFTGHLSSPTEAGRQGDSDLNHRSDNSGADQEWHFDSLSAVLKVGQEAPGDLTRENINYSHLDRDIDPLPGR